MDDESGLLEIRIFTLHPGRRAEFDRVSREETVPLMRSLGITVVTAGPDANDADSYVLVRRFASEQDRVSRSQSLYALPVWTEKYDQPVSAMIADYRTLVTSLP